jgi:uncharacterized protein YjiS (DUF1127 family)
MATVEFLNAAGRTQAAPAHGGIGSRLARAWHAWRMSRRVADAGRYLTEMDDHMLHDIGISRAQASFMASRPLLRAWWRN